MNKTAQFTPGPWEVTGPHSREVITTNPGTYKPCMTIAKVGGYWDGEAQANAALIAAAPAMYEALYKLMLEAIHYRNTGGGEQFLTLAIEQAQNALAQAEARS